MVNTGPRLKLVILNQFDNERETHDPDSVLRAAQKSACDVRKQSGALANEDLHGYGIIQAVSAQSKGRIRIGPGTLYDNLKRLMEHGWVRDLKPASEDDKRVYRLTAAGKAALSCEIGRLDELIRQTNRYLQGMEPRRAE
jgi:DNA-binding PadR family transcriptional regulator